MHPILEKYQHGFPLVSEPFAFIGREFGLSEEEVLKIFSKASEEHVLSRIGPVVRPNLVGVSALCAMEVPESLMEKTVRLVNEFPEVNHNYEREHRINLWFVLVCDDQARFDEVIHEVEGQTGLEVLNFPLVEEYFLDLGFALK